MNTIELFLLRLGASFSVAKFFPFLVLVLIGISLSLLFFRLPLLKFMPKLLKLIPILCLTFAPATIYFIYYPIYEGDIYDLSETPKHKVALNIDSELVVFALPGCKYCTASAQLMNNIQPYLSCKIGFWILGSDSSDVKTYKKLLNKNIHCELGPERDDILELTKGQFPTFFMIKNHQIQKVWHNNGFGVSALGQLDEN